MRNFLNIIIIIKLSLEIILDYLKIEIVNVNGKSD